MTALVLCCGILAAGPTLTILLPQPVSESAPTEEESNRVVAEEFCSRVPSRRLSPLPTPASDAIVNALCANGLSRAPRPATLGHQPAQLDHDVKLGSGAPLRC